MLVDTTGDGGVATPPRVGANVKWLRKKVGLSQEALAVRMRSDGFRWTQTTTYNVESGRRPLQFDEAVSLADIFGIELTTLIDGHFGIDDALTHVVEAGDSIITAVEAFIAARDELYAEVMTAGGIDRLPEKHRRVVTYTLGDYPADLQEQIDKDFAKIRLENGR